ncbi:MAG: ATP-binding protein [Deltaproteobacteria bacterium]|nr:ATP-binding protein [Deltaproteobacteria bacterium]
MTVALVTAAYHLALYWLWPEARDRAWAAVMVLGTAVYAGGAAILYSATLPSTAATSQRWMLVGGAVICHAVPPYLAALEGRAPGRWAGWLWGSLAVWVILLIFTPWVFAHTTRVLTLSWHDAPYLQPDAGPLNEICYLALLFVAAHPVIPLLRTWRTRSLRVRGAVVVLCLWLLLAAYDGLVGLRWIASGPAFFLEYGSLLLVLLLFGDSVTEHARLLRRAMEERSAAEEAFGMLARGSPDAIFLLRDAKIAFANESAARMVGITSPEALLGRALPHLVHTDDLEVFERDPEAPPRREGPPRHFVRFRREDLSLATAVVGVAAVVVEGEPALLAIARDVSEEEAMRARLMSADRQIAAGTLAAGLVRQIDEPLAEIGRQLVESLEQQDAGQPDCRSLLGEVYDRVAQVRGVVADLELASRIPEADRFEPQQLSELLAASLRLTRPLIEERARLEVDVRRLPPVVAGPGRLPQVFVNLLKNAAEAIPEGRPEEHRVRLLAFEEEGEAVIIVEDTGEGIEPQELKRIFDPFFTTRAAPGGTGLGLFICQRIVSGCGGEIEVRSRPGEGTRFTVRLPAAAS